jgi:hypothetical protein
MDVVPREAMALSLEDPGGSGLSAVYDDGDKRIEGPIHFGAYEVGNAPPHYPAGVLSDASAPLLWQSIWATGSEDLTGYLIAPRSGAVEFAISYDDDASMDLGDGLLVLTEDGSGYLTGSVSLAAGEYYAVTLHYANRAGSNGYHLYWRCN